MNQRNINLAQYFPMIRTETDILKEISTNPGLKSQFQNWRTDEQEKFLAMCSGSRGVKMLYDTYNKNILDPESTPERLSNLLNSLLGQKVVVKNALPNDNTRIGDEMSLVITDIVVQLEDGSLANVEVQKIGYSFTGQRSSCYSADLLLRQYRRVRDIKKEKFSYKDISAVYTIVFMEKSPSEFHRFKDTYVHSFSTVSDTGLKLNMLQNYKFIPVDIFIEKLHNCGIQSELDAWLTFLGCDEPQYIIELIERYPYFKPLYEDLYNICLNVERMMNMFSKELQTLDHNTVTYMIDELKEQLDNSRELLKASALDVIRFAHEDGIPDSKTRERLKRFKFDAETIDELFAQIKKEESALIK